MCIYLLIENCIIRAYRQIIQSLQSYSYDHLLNMIIVILIDLHKKFVIILRYYDYALLTINYNIMKCDVKCKNK